MNLKTQYYKGLPLKLINRKDYANRKAKRFIINNTNQNIWIPNSYLMEDGTIKDNVDLMRNDLCQEERCDKCIYDKAKLLVDFLEEFISK